MKTVSEHLIADLIERTRQNLNDAEKLILLPFETLNRRADELSWSALECIEHLNRYSNFYLREIENCLNNAKGKEHETFESGMLGNYFANSMLPKPGFNKMKTFKDKNPLGSETDTSVIQGFIYRQYKMLELLDRARNVSLQKNKVGITITSLLRLRLGDTFRFVIYHNQRHIVQAFNAVGIPYPHIVETYTDTTAKSAKPVH